MIGFVFVVGQLGSWKMNTDCNKVSSQDNTTITECSQLSNKNFFAIMMVMSPSFCHIIISSKSKTVLYNFCRIKKVNFSKQKCIGVGVVGWDREGFGSSGFEPLVGGGSLNFQLPTGVINPVLYM